MWRIELASARKSLLSISTGPGRLCTMAQIGSILHSSRTVGAKTLRYPSAHWKGPINYGDHVLQMGISGWSYSAKASQFAEAWRSFGQLVREIKGI
jgi:hypothetical protein